MKRFEIREFGIDKLVLVDGQEPQPGPGQALVRIRAASLNFRDLRVVQGLYNPKMPRLMVPLSDGAGEVLRTGPGVTRVKAGDRVAGAFMQGWIEGPVTEAKARTAMGGAIDGVASELVVLHEQGLVHVPEHLSFEEAATLPCAAVTAWNALISSGQIQPGETVLLLGTGGVSIFALQFSLIAGARTIITSSSDEKLERAQGLGAHQTINYQANADWDKAARGVDHVIEVGGPGTLGRSLRAVRHGGTVSVIGLLTGGEVNPVPILMKSVRAQGIYVGSREMFEAMNRAISLHQIRPVIDRTFAFDELPDALRHMEKGAHFGKIVLRFPD
jgi:NADPH:quinone reductase-like Zn-dependent oxidoreductase